MSTWSSLILFVNKITMTSELSVPMQLFAQLHFPFQILSRFQIPPFPIAPANGYIGQEILL